MSTAPFMGMTGSYIKIGLRTLRRNAGYAVISVVGLAIALAACLILGLYIGQSLSYDRFHDDAERLVRIVQYMPDGTGHATLPPGLASVIADQFPEVEAVTEVRGSASSEVTFTRDGDVHQVDQVMTVSSSFVDVFSFPVVRGNAEAALTGPNQLIMTESTAGRLFGDADPIGQILYRDGATPYTVAAIAADAPASTHLPFNVLVSGGRLEPNEPASVRWNFFGTRIYARLAPGTDHEAFTNKLNALRAEYVGDGPFADWVLSLQRVTNIHLHSSLNGEYASTSDVRYMYIFGAAGLLILLISCVNYVNLATARATERATEVGVRKVVGARRLQLVGQFVGEAMLVVLLSVPVALLLASVVLPFVNDLTGQELRLNMANSPYVWIAGLITLGIVGGAAGSYPALALSAFRPTAVLNGGGTTGRNSYWVRRSLILFQLTASIALVAGALVVTHQLDYLQTKRLGFEAAQVVTFRTPGWTGDELDVFKTSLEGQQSVASVAAGPPLGVGWRTYSMQRVSEETGETWELDMLTVGHDYLETAGLQLLAGRRFSRDYATDPREAIIVTKSMANRLGLEGDGLGPAPEPFETQRVVGVIDDIHNVALRRPLNPTVLQLDPDRAGVVMARLRPGHVEEGLVALEEAWKALVPERPFVFEFLDERIQSQYLAEQRLSRVFSLFAGVAILLAAVGLFGLSAYAVRQRTKEIGIRKVLGASVASIVGLLTKEFLVLVLVAIAMATPIAYVGMDRWLRDFAYHVEVGPELVLFVAGIAVAVALASVWIQAVRAAVTNPADALRYE